ncbi:hypothetical protein Dsin_004339 [Dipteronia sinensis]|uniref:Zinc finger MYM-type protein 1-like n=1 Tax=Dipteronia sinensis TaxID=43782 RepID=A0AAE0BAN3_9ROSI|nr:hypothetical protein Dsin_004339 [Dipteronia sinensis]
MAIILRYVDYKGFVRERFFQVVSVNDTNASTLKKEICNVLARYDLSIENLRGQGYDGASNMRGEWNGLQALFLKDCPYAYYIHCFAHRLQLALVAHHSDLKSIREGEIQELTALGELETSTGANQICTLQRPGTTHWSSHFTSIGRLINMFGSTSTLLENLIDKGLNMSTTKMLLQKLRESEWDTFLESVVSFCERYEIDIPNMNARHMEGTKRSCQQKDNITVKHYYHFSIFIVVIDYQLIELNNIFPEQTIELLTLSMALSPIDVFKSFNVDDIFTLANKFYYEDFSKNDIEDLRRQLSHYKLDVFGCPEFQILASLSELCQCLAETKRSEHYTLIDKLICLVFTLLVSTATTERAFSTMKLVKTPLRNKMDGDFLTDCMVIFIEKERLLISLT